MTGLITEPPTFTATNDLGSSLEARVCLLLVAQVLTTGNVSASVQVWFEYSEVLWPYTGFVAVYLTVVSDADETASGVATGQITLTVSSPSSVRWCCLFCVILPAVLRTFF